jgi:hypothetical protein
MLHRPTYDAPGVNATVASACSRPSCQLYAWPPLTLDQLGIVVGRRLDGGTSAGVWFK